MKKFLWIFLPFLLFFNFFEISSAKDFEKVVVGLDTNVMPMGFINEKGEIDGFDIDLAKLVFKNMGKKVIFQPINWDSKELELDSGNIDVIWNGMSYTKEREEKMELSKAYMENSQIAILNKNSKSCSLEELKRGAVCVQKGSTGFEALKKHKIYGELKEVVQLENMMDCLNDVINNRCCATIVDEVVFKYFAKKKGLDDSFKVVKEPISKEDYVIAFKKGNKSLKDQVEKTLKDVIKTGEAEKISQKWFGENLLVLKDSKKVLENIKKESENYFFIELLKGGWVSLKLFFFCILFSLPLGFLVCFLRVKKFKILNMLIDIYILIMRGTPLLLQMFFIFYGLPIIFPNFIFKSRFLVGVFAFVINYAAYFAEIFRGGFKSIPAGQFDAIKALKIPKVKATLRIVLPQIFKVTLPSICNETITLVKDTALIFSIGVVELLTTAKNLVNSSLSVFPYFLAAIIYLFICFLINMIFKYFERMLKF